MRPVAHDASAFGADPSYRDQPYSAAAQQAIYGGKHLNATARPLIEAGRRLYDHGLFRPAGEGWGQKNPTAHHFMVYGDLRLAAGYVHDDIPGANGKREQSTLAARLNLDLDWQFTATERIHAFVRPFDQNGSFLRYDFAGRNEDEFVDEFDFDLETFFFEGEVGTLLMGMTGRENSIDVPFTVGLIPLFTQNGIWLNDAFYGGAISLMAAKSNPKLGISNVDLTFFVGLDDVQTGAVVGKHAARVAGFAGFVDANRGYWEFGYGYVDSEAGNLGYHNLTVAFSRRYGAFISNSIRVIGNLGQDPDFGPKTADGVLLLIENSLITHRPQTFIPYINFFVGFDQPQPLARAEGGVLQNTGINFEADAITGYPSLNATGHDAFGGALGIEYLFNLDRQIVVEAAFSRKTADLDPIGDEYAVGLRFQEPLNNAWIFRVDAMHAWRETLADIYGLRLEIRRKF